MDRIRLNRTFYALLNGMGIMDRKDEILSGYGVESSKDLTDDQLQQLVHRLKDEQQSRNESRVKTRRSVILRLLTDIGVYYVIEGEPKYGCWGRVNAFLSSPKIAGRELYKLSEVELIALERKLRTMKTTGYYYRRQFETASATPTASIAPGPTPAKPQVVPIVVHMNADSDPTKVN